MSADAVRTGRSGFMNFFPQQIFRMSVLLHDSVGCSKNGFYGSMVGKDLLGILHHGHIVTLFPNEKF